MVGILAAFLSPQWGDKTMRKILYRTTLGLSAVALAKSGAGAAQASPVVEEEYYGFSVKMVHEGSLDGL
ncbi:hypothetical protein D3791_06885 [Glutamicibacter mishrai]|uniref:Uncharacterized protein n=1 Tax=Glutamicibacter mishrai TaxID=1775880 RepID=A0A6H0SI81_9MICC|nr:hypothetical protein D3791_06885 [Glutamicibacter mishrai]